jgi:hypothetical protein
MAIVNLNMGNLNLEVSYLKNKFVTEEKEKVVLHVERDFHKAYKHNIEIWKKNRVENE